MPATTAITIIGAYNRNRFVIIARQSSILSRVRTGGNFLDLIRNWLPGLQNRSYIVTAVSHDTLSSIATLEVPGTNSWEIWLSNPNNTEEFMLGIVPRSISTREVTIDLREPARIVVLGKYYNFQQESFSHQEVESYQEEDLRFSVEVNKTRIVPNGLLEFYQSQYWPKIFDPVTRTISGETTNQAENNPFEFYTLKGEDCTLTITSCIPNHPQRTGSRKLRNIISHGHFSISLKEETTRVTFVFQDSSGNPLPAYHIHFWSQAHRRMPEFSSTLDQQGRQVFIGEFKRLTDWVISATEFNQQAIDVINEMREGIFYPNHNVSPTSSVESVPFPDLNTTKVTKTIKFPAITGTVTINFPVQFMKYASDDPPVVDIGYNQVFRTNGDVYSCGTTQWERLALSDYDATYWFGNKVYELEKGYAYLFWCGYNWGTEQTIMEWQYPRRLNATNAWYKLGPFNQDEELVSVLFGVIP